MDIKEAFDTVLNVLETECGKQCQCQKCIFSDVCNEAYVYPHTFVRHLRDCLLSQKSTDKKGRKLVNNHYFNRVMAMPGDKVICLDNGGSYTTYDSFFKQMRREDLADRYCHAALQVGRVYTVMDVGPHFEFTCNVYILHDSETDKIFLCTDDTDYLKRVTNSYKWTQRSTVRIDNCIHEVENEIDKVIPHRFLEGGYLQLEDGCRTLVIPAATKMSFNNIKRRILKWNLEKN